MNSDLDRYLTGSLLIFSAICLIYLGENAWSCVPSVAGIYILGSLLWEKIKEIR